jgi:hypothetical protein
MYRYAHDEYITSIFGSFIFLSSSSTITNVNINLANVVAEKATLAEIIGLSTSTSI